MKQKQTVKKLAGAQNKAAKMHLSGIREEWLDKLSDVSKYRC